MAHAGKPTFENFRFRDKALEDYTNPDLNPHLRAHLEHGVPVLTAAQAASNRGKWQEHFERDAPLHVEIGSGNGFFLAGRAKQSPEFNWLGLEIRFKRVMQAALKIERADVVQHTRIARYNAFQLSDLFKPGEIDCLYINHPDPWPKRKHDLNRLLSANFFEGLAPLMRNGAELRLKTDHILNINAARDNALFGIHAKDWELIGESENVNDGGPPWELDVVTNYQRKFVKRNEPVYALWLRRVDARSLVTETPSLMKK
jgi:tRNA (guanine-N7-)-methyltransferase